MTIGLSFIDRVKALSRGLASRNSDALAAGGCVDLLALPPASRQNPWSDAPEIEAVAIVIARAAIGAVDRRGPVSQKRRREMEHTHSNLG